MHQTILSPLDLVQGQLGYMIQHTLHTVFIIQMNKENYMELILSMELTILLWAVKIQMVLQVQKVLQ